MTSYYTCGLKGSCPLPQAVQFHFVSLDPTQSVEVKDVSRSFLLLQTKTVFAGVNKTDKKIGEKGALTV